MSPHELDHYTNAAQVAGLIVKKDCLDCNELRAIKATECLLVSMPRLMRGFDYRRHQTDSADGFGAARQEHGLALLMTRSCETQRDFF